MGMEDVYNDVLLASLQCWQDLEEKWGIKFWLKDGHFRPVNEWLDDLYLRFSPRKALLVIEDILNNGEILFADLLKHKE